MDINQLFTKQELQDALQLHHEQLERLDATLEDSVCEILQKMLDNYEPKPRWSDEELLSIEDMPDPCEECSGQFICGSDALPRICSELDKYEVWKKAKRIK